MRLPLIIRQTGSTDAGTAAYVESLPVPPGQLWLVRGAAVLNNSGESITSIFGLLDMGDFVNCDPKQTVSDADAYSNEAYLLLREGERFAVQVTGAANKGKVTLTASGWIITPDPEIVIVSAGAK